MTLEVEGTDDLLISGHSTLFFLLFFLFHFHLFFFLLCYRLSFPRLSSTLYIRVFSFR